MPGHNSNSHRLQVSQTATLAKPRLFVTAAREGADRLLPFVATIVGVLATDLLAGIGIGLAVSLLVATRHAHALPGAGAEPRDADH
ncbi:hypothetical protein [Mycetohabitans sp. B46]|uniref:hypothetical protein n=1 Tax=Mycetohabitans sp. B46 TaxID=2772536 RepID=UPI00307EE856